jgi:hypothetical protein
MFPNSGPLLDRINHPNISPRFINVKSNGQKVNEIWPNMSTENSQSFPACSRIDRQYEWANGDVIIVDTD